jgi:hypothetical protein
MFVEPSLGARPCPTHGRTLRRVGVASSTLHQERPKFMTLFRDAVIAYSLLSEQSCTDSSC